ncbi:MAG: bifunctional response regulator/alkaline phosphatase family protein [bacterium]|nr:MAG: bifunctional response regulator/alkaline phosphatase family protein [bacterium]
MKGRKILWVDDEIDLLKSHILFLEEKGYDVRGVASGDEAIGVLRDERFDLILLDETMPGKSGLETLQEIKEIDSNLPIIMITKNEAENLMEQAIGMKIDDYLLKPINPLQIYSAAKRLLDAHRIREGAVSKDYLQVYRQVNELLGEQPTWNDWARIHQDLSAWDLEFDQYSETGLGQTHSDLKRKCNADFGHYVEENYREWINSDQRPLLSVGIFKHYVLPHIYTKRKAYLIIIDCMRYDQWLTIEDLLVPYYNIERETYYSILPTATPYSRNAIFSGLFPIQIQEQYPQYWLERSKDELSKNRFENELMLGQLQKNGLGHISSKYLKIYEIEEANEIRKQVDSYRTIDFVAMVFNFLDILSHGRSQSEILQEIAPDESAFRSLMRSWFSHSALFEILQTISKHDGIVFITTDHGSILGQKASLVHGNRDTSTNLRYKFGENINGDSKQTLLIRKPRQYKLPSESPSKNYILAKENYYFVYPTRFHEYEKQYHGTFQHGGISLEEMIVPFITLTPK